MNNNLSQMPSSDDSKVIGFGFSVIFLVFFLFGGWMYLAPLDNASIAVGQVSADVDKKTIQHLEGGIVKEIFVKDNEFVQKGQKLLKLDDIQTKSQLQIFQDQLDDSIAIESRLIAQRDNLDSVIYPEYLNNQNLIDAQNSIFYNSKKSIEDENEITINRIKQLNSQKNGLNAVITSKINRVNSLKEEIKEWEELLKEQLTDKIKIRELKRELNLLEGEISNTSSEIAKIEEQISELENQKLLREKEFRKETLDKLVEIKSNISDLKSKILAYEDIIKRTLITSPINGYITGMNLHTIGGVITPGANILDVVPESTDLIIIAQVQTTDIDKVTEGLFADIRFSAFNLNNTHVIEGKVINVSADSFIDEATGMPYYKARIKVTKDGIEQLKKYNFNLVAGMPAEVMIKVGERTALSYFIKPFSDMLSRGFNED